VHPVSRHTSRKPRPRPARHPKEFNAGGLGVRETDGVRTIGGWIYKNVRLLEDEEVIANALGARWMSRDLLVYLTTKRIVCLPGRVPFRPVQDAHLADVQRLSIDRSGPLWLWRLSLPGYRLAFHDGSRSRQFQSGSSSSRMSRHFMKRSWKWRRNNTGT